MSSKAVDLQDLENQLLWPRIFALYKPAGPTSTRVLSQFKGILRRILGRVPKKIGHFGTLDPFAEGLLLVGTGGAMRLMEFAHRDLIKTYRARGPLGIWTETGDLTAKRSEWWEDPNFCFSKQETLQSSSMLAALGKDFLGEYWQRPAVYSATKFEGKPLYEWAREKGRKIEKPPVLRHIHDLKLETKNETELELVADVSGGTYIRVLFDDIARQLGTRGALSTLSRENIGNISIEMSSRLEDLESLSARELLDQSFCPSVCFDYPHIEISEAAAKIYLNGGEVEASPDLIDTRGPVWVYGTPHGKNEGVRYLLGLSCLEGRESFKGQLIFSAAQRVLL